MNWVFSPTEPLDSTCQNLLTSPLATTAEGQVDAILTVCFYQSGKPRVTFLEALWKQTPSLGFGDTSDISQHLRTAFLVEDRASWSM